MKLIGIDYGRRRIGVAATDETGEYIRGLPTIDRLRVNDYIAALRTVIEQEHPEKIVIGLPLDIDGDETVMSKEIRAFASALTAAAGLPVAFVDESLSSKAATAHLRLRKKKDRRNKEAVDRIAACVILESFQKGLTCD
jgi:putative holliday junction resolvase